MTDAAVDLPIRTVRAGALDVGYLEMGEGPLVILLHGFPDTALSYRRVLPRLADAGFRAVAPFLRGYAPTSLPADGDHSIDALARDLLAVADAVGARDEPGGRVAVVGHDWGAAITQYAANLAPERFSRIVLASLPHLRTFLLEPRPAQLRRSHYIFRFQVPGWAERRIPADDFAWLEEQCIRRWSPTWDYAEADLAPVKERFRDPVRLRSALSYYRQVPRVFAHRSWMRTAFAPVTVPTRALYGTVDGCIGAELFPAQRPRFTGGLDLVPAEGRGHFLQAEDPEWFAAQVVDWLDAPGTR